MGGLKRIYRLKLAILYALVGLILVTPAISKQIKKADTTSKVASISIPVQASRQVQELGMPEQAILPKQSIVVHIEEGIFQTNAKTWKASDNNAAWIRYSSRIEDEKVMGDTIIYGHNIPSIFKNTSTLVVGDELVIKTSNNVFLSYKYVSDQIVVPENIELLNSTLPNTTTLITCTGKNDSMRRLMKFEYKGLSHER